jgi:hypothetical protein
MNSSFVLILLIYRLETLTMACWFCKSLPLKTFIFVFSFLIPMEGHKKWPTEYKEWVKRQFRITKVF